MKTELPGILYQIFMRNCKQPNFANKTKAVVQKLGLEIFHIPLITPIKCTQIPSICSLSNKIQENSLDNENAFQMALRPELQNRQIFT